MATTRVRLRSVGAAVVDAAGASTASAIPLPRLSRVARHPMNNAITQSLLSRALLSLREQFSSISSLHYDGRAAPPPLSLAPTGPIDCARLLHAARRVAESPWPLPPLLFDANNNLRGRERGMGGDGRGGPTKGDFPSEAAEAALCLISEFPFLLDPEWRAGHATATTATEAQTPSPIHEGIRTSGPPATPSAPTACAPLSISSSAPRITPAALANAWPAPHPKRMAAREVEGLFGAVRRAVEDQLAATHEERFANRGRERGRAHPTQKVASDPTSRSGVRGSSGGYKKNRLAKDRLSAAAAAEEEESGGGWSYEVRLSPIGPAARGAHGVKELHILMTHSGVTTAAIRARAHSRANGRSNGGGAHQHLADPFFSSSSSPLSALAEEERTREALSVILFKAVRALELSGVARKVAVVDSGLPDTVSIRLLTLPRLQRNDVCAELGAPLPPSASAAPAAPLAPGEGCSSNDAYPPRSLFLHVVPWDLYEPRRALLRCEATLGGGRPSAGRPAGAAREALWSLIRPHAAHASVRSAATLSVAQACAEAEAALHAAAEARGFLLSYDDGLVPLLVS